jgi:taurine dioxygenase
LAVSVTPLTPAIGGLIEGVDTADAAALERDGAELRQALLDRQVIFFRKQQLTPDAQVRLAAVFGTVNDVSSTFAHHPD